MSLLWYKMINFSQYIMTLKLALDLMYFASQNLRNFSCLTQSFVKLQQDKFFSISL